MARTAEYADWDQQAELQDRYDRLLLYMAEVRQARVAGETLIGGMGGHQVSYEGLQSHLEQLKDEKRRLEKQIGTDPQSAAPAFVSSRPGR